MVGWAWLDQVGWDGYLPMECFACEVKLVCEYSLFHVTTVDQLVCG